MKRRFFLLGAAALVVACGGAVTSEPVAKGEPCARCDAMPSTVRRCDDGSVLGAECVGVGDGTCIAAFPECPASSSPGNPGAAACGAAGQPACAAGSYCKTGAACGGAGTCATKPRGCTFDYTPVCGCDGKVYGNECAAAQAGISVAFVGECGGAVGAACGTRGAPAACVAGSFCRRDIAAACGEADAPGVCTQVPTACDTGFEPVCGCDGKTYSNACEADAAKVSVRSTGSCR